MLALNIIKAGREQYWEMIQNQRSVFMNFQNLKFMNTNERITVIKKDMTLYYTICKLGRNFYTVQSQSVLIRICIIMTNFPMNSTARLRERGFLLISDGTWVLFKTRFMKANFFRRNADIKHSINCLPTPL